MFLGFLVTWKAEVSVVDPIAYSSMLVLPSCRRRWSKQRHSQRKRWLGAPSCSKGPYGATLATVMYSADSTLILLRECAPMFATPNTELYM